MAIRRVTYEQSPIATFLDFEMPRLMMARQAEERSRQHQLELEDKRGERALNVASWQANEQRLTKLQDDFIAAGLKLKPEFQSTGYADLSQSILDDTKGNSQALLDTIQEGDTQIEWMENQLAEARAGEQYAKQVEGKYLSAGQTSEDYSSGRFMLEGGFKQDDSGNWVAADPKSELGMLLTDLKANDPNVLGNLSNEAFRKGFNQGRYDTSLVKERQDAFAGELSILSVKQDLDNKQLDRAQQKIGSAKAELEDNMRYYGHNFTGTLNLAGHSFGMIQMLEELDDQTEIFGDFQEMINSGKIDVDVGRIVMEKLSSFGSAIKDPKANPHEFFVDMAAEAYDDLLAFHELQEQTKLSPDDIKYVDENNLTVEEQKIWNKANSWIAVGLGKDLDRIRRAKEIKQQYTALDDLQDEKLMLEIGLDPASAQSLIERIPYDELPEVTIDTDLDILNILNIPNPAVSPMATGDSELDKVLEEAVAMQKKEGTLKGAKTSYKNALRDLLHGVGWESNEHLVDEMIVQGLLPGVPRGSGLPDTYLFSDEAMDYLDKRIKRKAGHAAAKGNPDAALRMLEEWGTYQTTYNPFATMAGEIRTDRQKAAENLDLFLSR